MGVRDVIAQRKKLPRVEEKEVPIIGKVNILRLSTADALAIEATKETFVAQMVAATCLDEEHEPLFASEKEVSAMDWATVDALFAASQTVNNLSRADAVKKSTDGPGSAPSSPSPPASDCDQTPSS